MMENGFGVGLGEGKEEGRIPPLDFLVFLLPKNLHVVKLRKKFQSNRNITDILIIIDNSNIIVIIRDTQQSTSYVNKCACINTENIAVVLISLQVQTRGISKQFYSSNLTQTESRKI